MTLTEHSIRKALFPLNEMADMDMFSDEHLPEENKLHEFGMELLHLASKEGMEAEAQAFLEGHKDVILRGIQEENPEDFELSGGMMAGVNLVPADVIGFLKLEKLMRS